MATKYMMAGRVTRIQSGATHAFLSFPTSMLEDIWISMGCTSMYMMDRTSAADEGDVNK